MEGRCEKTPAKISQPEFPELTYHDLLGAIRFFKEDSLILRDSFYGIHFSCPIVFECVAFFHDHPSKVKSTQFD